MLRHELTHHRRRDLWVKGAAKVLCLVHWFNPVAHLLARRLSAWLEYACDEAVVESMDAAQRKAYGCAILDVLARTQGQSAGVSAALCEDQREMKARLRAMLRVKAATPGQKVTAAAVLAGICLAGVLIGAAAYRGSAPLPESAKAPPAALEAEPALPVQAAVALPDPQPEELLHYEGGPPTQFLWPVMGGEPPSTYEGHSGNGVDIRPGDGGKQVYAAADGMAVKVVRQFYGYGHYMIIDHGGGFETCYAHLEAIYLEEGDLVEAGQEIGLMGKTGLATVTHLHFEVRRDGAYGNPLDFVLPENAPADLPLNKG